MGRLLGGGRSPWFPAATVTIVALLSAAFAPAATAASAATDPVITVTAGGDRSSGTSVDGLNGVTFQFFAGVRGTAPSGTPTATCVSGSGGTAGECGVDVAARSGGGTGANQAGYWVVQTSVPAGWFADANLNTGAAGSIATTDYSKIFVPSVTSDVSVPIAVTNNASVATARGSAWATSRDNPALPDKCGLKVALLFDVSGSIGGNIGQLRAAGNTFVDALTGTPSSVGVYTFAARAPASRPVNANLGLTSVSTAASASAVTSKINGLTVESGTQATTNWDQGLWQIAADTTNYDVALVLTDGNPTVYGPSAQGPGSSTRFIEVENGIFSANALKAKGTTILGVGIGNVGASASNLASISGPNEGSDYFATDFSELGTLLETLALKNCKGTVNVVKEVIPASTPGDFAAAVPEPGWTFTAAPDTVVPTTGVTDANGAISFATSTSGSQPVTLTETVQAGYQFVPVTGGDNASCQNSDGAAVPVTNAVDPPGFTVDALANESVTCEVFNQELAEPDPSSVIVNKSWDIDGVTNAEVNEGADFQADLTLVPLHPSTTEPVWGAEYNGYLAGDTVAVGEDNVTLPPGCTNVASGDLGAQVLAAGLNTFQITNTVTCTTQLTAVKDIRNPFVGATTAPIDSWTLTARPAVGGPAVINGTSGATATITAGLSYVLAESAVPGYGQEIVPGSVLADGATGSWHCTQELEGGGSGLEDYTGADGTVTVPPGEHVICTTINDPRPATLTLVKHVANPHGGTAVPADWTLTAAPGELTTPVSGTVSGRTGSRAVTDVPITPGVPYRLSESGPAGYPLTGLSCLLVGTETRAPLTDRTLTPGIGQDISCTFSDTQAVPTPEPAQPASFGSGRLPVGGAATGEEAAATHPISPLVGVGVILLALGGLTAAAAVRRRGARA